MTDAIRSALEAARADYERQITKAENERKRAGDQWGYGCMGVVYADFYRERAKKHIAQIDAALASLDAPQTDALREAENAVSHAFGLLSSAVRCGEAWRQELDDAKDRARTALARLKGEGEKPDPIEDDDPSRADEDWFFDHDGKP